MSKWKNTPQLTHTPWVSHRLSDSPRVFSVIQNRLYLLRAILGSSWAAYMVYQWDLSASLWIMVYVATMSMSKLEKHLETHTSYTQGIKHLKQFWRIGDAYFKKIAHMDNHVIWYCNLQWLYLASKEYWVEAEFFSLKEKYSRNKISHF